MTYRTNCNPRFVPILACLCLWPLAGCDSLGGAVDPPNKEISVSAALADVGKGFALLQYELRGQTLGLFPCKLAVTLDVRASAQSDNRLVVGDISELGYETGAKREQGRENQVTVEFYNPACVPEKTAGYKDPKTVQELKTGMLISRQELEEAANSPVTR